MGLYHALCLGGKTYSRQWSSLALYGARNWLVGPLVVMVVLDPDYFWHLRLLGLHHAQKVARKTYRLHVLITIVADDSRYQ